MKTLILYHGNTEDAVDEIINANKLLVKYKSTGNKHYLGDGYYFYDDLTQAMVWAKMKVKRKYPGEKWAVLKCKIAVKKDGIFDLDKRRQQDFFFKEMQNFEQELHKLDKDNYKLTKYSDSSLCNYLGNMLGLSLITKTFVYKDMLQVYPPSFSNRKVSPYFITRHFRTEKQYVLRDSSLVVSMEKVNSKSLKNSGVR